jgi:hypothetical protein
MTVRHRILQIRRWVAAIAITVFIALFATIYVQMASGNDPALAKTTSSQQQAATPSQTQSQTPSGVTTRQS